MAHYQQRGGVGLLNDWSARDIQGFETVPLGPFLGNTVTIAARAGGVSLGDVSGQIVASG